MAVADFCSITLRSIVCKPRDPARARALRALRSSPSSARSFAQSISRAFGVYTLRAAHQTNPHATCTPQDAWSDEDRSAFTNAMLDEFLSSSLADETVTAGPPPRGGHGPRKKKGSGNGRADVFRHSLHGRRTLTQSATNGVKLGGPVGRHAHVPETVRQRQRSPLREDEGEHSTLSSMKTNPAASQSSHEAPKKRELPPRATEGIEEAGRGLQGPVMTHLLDGNFDEEYLQGMPTTVLNWVIKTLGKQDRLDLAEQLFHWMRIKKIANEHSLVKLFEACEACAVSPRRALSIWRNARRLDTGCIRPAERAAAALLKTYRVHGDVAGAKRALRDLKATGTVLNQYAFNVALRIAADKGDVDAAFAIYDELKSCLTATPDARTFSGLLSAVAAAAKWPRAAVVHRMIKESGVRLDGPLAVQLLHCYARCGRAEAAEAVLDAMSDDGMKPGRTHWNALLHAYAESRKYDGAIKAYRRMTDGAGITPDSYTLVAVLTAAARAKAGPAAASWALATAQSYAVPMSLPLASALLNCCRQPPVPELESTGVNDGTNSSTSSGTTSRTTAKTPTTTRQTTFSTSMVLVAEIRAAMRAARIEPNVAVFNTLLAAHAHAGDWEGVQATLKDLEESEDVEPNENTWGIALAAFQKAGWWQDVEGVEALRDTWRTLHGGRGA